MEDKMMTNENMVNEELIEAVEEAMDLDVKKVVLIGGGIGLVCAGGLVVYLKRDKIREYIRNKKAKRAEKKKAKKAEKEMKKAAKVK